MSAQLTLSRCASLSKNCSRAVAKHSRCAVGSTASEMLLAELLEIIRNGESSGVEFKRDDVRPEDLAKELCAFANLEGGHVLLGVEKDGTITGLTRAPADAEE